jgi:tricorn protease-like protein
MIRNKKVPISSDKLNLFIIDIKTGNNRTISTSKIKKIMARKR